MRTDGRVNAELARLRAGITRAAEAIEDGDYVFALELLLALEPAARRGAQCRQCGFTAAWPGLIEAHRAVVHGFERAGVLDRAA